MDEDTDIFADPPEPAVPSTAAETPHSSSDAPQPVHTSPTLDRLSLTSSPVASDTCTGSHHSGHSHAADQHASGSEAPKRDSADGDGFGAEPQAGEAPAATSSIANVQAGAAPLASSSMAAAKHPFGQISEPSGAGTGTRAGGVQGCDVQTNAPSSPEPMQMDPPAAVSNAGETCLEINLP